MRLLAFSVYDSKADAYLRPFFAPTRGLAVRSFVDTVNSGNGDAICKHPADFTLFYVGAFDEDTGMFERSEPVTLGNALTFREEA